MRHPSMTTRGTQIAIVVAIVLAFFLPRHVPCGRPGASCNREGRWHTTCVSYEVEPFGFYLIELVAKRDVGFAYSTGDDCR